MEDKVLKEIQKKAKKDNVAAFERWFSSRFELKTKIIFLEKDCFGSYRKDETLLLFEAWNAGIKQRNRYD